MTISLEQAVQFNSLYKELREKEMPVKIAYRLNTIQSECEKKVSFFETSMGQIIQKYGKKDENGEIERTEDGNYKIEQEKLSECSAEIQELYNLEVDLPDYKFSLDDLEFLKLSLAQIGILMPFIKEEE